MTEFSFLGELSPSFPLFCASLNTGYLRNFVDSGILNVICGQKKGKGNKFMSTTLSHCRHTDD